MSELTELQKLSGAMGSVLLDGTHTAQKLGMIISKADMTITALTYTKRGGVGTRNGFVDGGYSGKTIEAGATITPPLGYYISAITISAGSAIGFLTK